MSNVCVNWEEIDGHVKNLLICIFVAMTIVIYIPM